MDIGLEQWQQVLWELGEQRRLNAQMDRIGTVHKVWAKDGEQKVQIRLGIKPEGATPNDDGLPPLVQLATPLIFRRSLLMPKAV